MNCFGSLLVVGSLKDRRRWLHVLTHKHAKLTYFSVRKIRLPYHWVFSCFYSPSLSSVICKKDITKETLLDSFLNYIDDFEKEAACRMLQGKVEDGDDDAVIGMLSCFSLPNCENIQQCMLECAKIELIC